MRDNKFGEFLVMHDVIRMGDLVKALKIQSELLVNHNIEKKLGEVLVDEMKMFDMEKLDELLYNYVNQ